MNEKSTRDIFYYWQKIYFKAQITLKQKYAKTTTKKGFRKTYFITVLFENKYCFMKFFIMEFL